MKKAINRKNVVGFDRYDDVYTEFPLTNIISVSEKSNFFEVVYENKTTLQLYICSDQIIRFRYAIDGNFAPDFSYAIDYEGFEQKRNKNTSVEVSENETDFILKTALFSVLLNKNSGCFCVNDHEGTTLLEQTSAQTSRSILKGIFDVRTSFKTEKDASFWGLGDKSCGLNLRGQKQRNWNLDAFAYNEKRDDLYRSVPFYYGLNTGKAYGVFFDNPYRSTFDFCKTKKNQTTISAEGGDINFYVFVGPKMLDVAVNYHKLTGTPELPALWTLGFHQCRWSYYPQERVHQVADKFRALAIPCDSLYLDIDYMDGWRCFTWNAELFPDPKDMIAKLDAQGFHTVVMIDPGIKAEKGYAVYDDGMAQGMFCKRSNGETMIGPVWPDSCVWPEFTNPKVREWFGTLYHDLYNNLNISGFWNDMNEPAVFQVNSLTFPDEVLHDYDGHPTNHKKAHNIYGMQMARATYEGLKKLKPEKRPFLLTRANFAGGQRFAAVWTGDNVANWAHLKLANTQCQRLSISGFSHCGTDIGGFVDLPTGELMVRWLQLAVFHPLMRIHSMGNHGHGASMIDDDSIKESERFNRMDQEPWSFGAESTDSSRKAIELRYRLLPVVYHAFHRFVSKGIPMMQSMSFAYQTDNQAIAQEFAFMFADFLVYPVMEEAAKSTEIYLPEGNWYNFETTTHCLGNQTFGMEVSADTLPIFVKAGSIVPLHPVRQHTREKVETLTLQIYAGEIGTVYESELYQDMGEGYDTTSTCMHYFTHSFDGQLITLNWNCKKGTNYVADYDKIILEYIIPDGKKTMKEIDVKSFFD